MSTPRLSLQACSGPMNCHCLMICVYLMQPPVRVPHLKLCPPHHPPLPCSSPSPISTQRSPSVPNMLDHISRSLSPCSSVCTLWCLHFFATAHSKRSVFHLVCVGGGVGLAQCTAIQHRASRQTYVAFFSPQLGRGSNPSKQCWIEFSTDTLVALCNSPSTSFQYVDSCVQFHAV